MAAKILPTVFIFVSRPLICPLKYKNPVTWQKNKKIFRKSGCPGHSLLLKYS
jgi:hypothetical protein